jgi:dTMP kinase
MSTTEGGVLISFEGNEGSGKSTQLKLLADRLRAEGFQVVENTEPGGTPIGRQIRRILLDPSSGEIAPMAELLLMFASRAQAAATVIVPALKAGCIVLTDRFTDSSLVYQGSARELGFEKIRELHRLALGTVMPDLTLCIEIDLEASLARARRRNSEGNAAGDETRFDEQSHAFHQKVRDGYHRIAREEPQRFHIIDGNGAPAQVAERIWELVRPVVAGRKCER